MRNFINRHDFFDAWARLKNWRSLRAYSLPTGKSRVVSHWNRVTVAGTLGMLEERANRLVTGDPQLSRFEYVAQRYLAAGGLVALSVGCGDGRHEVTWARQGVFSRIDGIDIAPDRISAATESARTAGVGHICNFQVEELSARENAAAGSYDVIIFESALHHLTPMGEVVRSVRNLLKPDGLVLLYDYVGPCRWQWLPGQLKLVNALIDLLPADYKSLPGGHMLAQRFRPSLLRMYLMDPSEAAESEQILPQLRAHFSEIEFRNAGGALLHHFLPKIQHNFDPQNDMDRSWLATLFAIEDMHLHDSDNIGLWYGFGVFAKGAGTASDAPSAGEHKRE